jgi:PAS domain S-box-containing protein
LPAPGNQLFNYLITHASLGIAVEDLEGQLLLANPVLCSMLGYHEDELCGMHCSEFANSEDSEDDLALFQRLSAGAIDRYSLEKRYTRKDGVQFWGRLNVSMWRDEDGGSPLVFAFVEDITDRKLSESALASVSRRLIEAQERERLRISRELHDDIAQRVAMLAIELQQLLEDPFEACGRIAELQKQTAEIAADVHSLSHELHSSKLDFLGLAAATKSFCQEFETKQKVKIDLRTDDLPTALPPDISLCFFRVLQESLRNAAKYSGVRHFEVRLWGASSEIHLTVNDSGVGFDKEEAAKASRGLGLISMEERLKMLNGTFSIDSRPQQGTRVHACAPFS